MKVMQNSTGKFEICKNISRTFLLHTYLWFNFSSSSGIVHDRFTIIRNIKCVRFVMHLVITLTTFWDFLPDNIYVFIFDSIFEIQSVLYFISIDDIRYSEQPTKRKHTKRPLAKIYYSF